MTIFSNSKIAGAAPTRSRRQGYASIVDQEMNFAYKDRRIRWAGHCTRLRILGGIDTLTEEMVQRLNEPDSSYWFKDKTRFAPTRIILVVRRMIPVNSNSSAFKLQVRRTAIGIF